MKASPCLPPRGHPLTGSTGLLGPLSYRLSLVSCQAREPSLSLKALRERNHEKPQRRVILPSHDSPLLHACLFALWTKVTSGNPVSLAK